MIDIRTTIPNSNHGGLRNTAIDCITFHHIVGDAQAAINRFRQAGVEVSSTYIIGSDGQVYYTVSENQIPYTNGEYSWNKRSITIEHAGGGPVAYTEAMYRASIDLCRDIMKRYNITNIKRHRDIVATACPGGLDVERIIREAKQGGVEVIDQNDVGLLRIGHSEVGNWDSATTHRGDHDARFMGSWVGKPVKDFIWAQWNNGQPHRINNVAFDNLQTQLKATTDKLAQVSAQAELSAKLQKQVDDLTVKNKEVLDQQAKDTEIGNSVIRWLGNLFNKK